MSGLTLAALGDSVTFGVGDIGKPAGWAAHLAVALGAQRFENLAVNGARARDVAVRQLPAAVTVTPHLATVLVGGNDVLRSDFRPQEIAAHVSASASALVDRGADVLVVLLHDPRRVTPGPRVVRQVLAERAHQVNSDVRASLHRMDRVAILDPRETDFSHESTNWHIDRMHPSARGHRLLAELALSSLSPLGWAPQRPIPAAPVMPTSPLKQAGWLLRHGVPWFAKRSTDLLPELAWVCWQHHRQANAGPRCSRQERW